jgi:hypothetical protein
MDYKTRESSLVTKVSPSKSTAFLLMGLRQELYLFKRDQSVTHERIRKAVKRVSPETLDEDWQKLDYHLNPCRATKGAHIKLMTP